MPTGETRATVGYSNDYPGGYAERMVLAAPLLLEVPNGLPSEHAALTEPLAVGIHAVEKAALAADDVPLVIGCGPVGLAAIAGLGDAHFEAREAAMRQLSKWGTAAVDPLAQAAAGDNLEVTWRAIRALGRILDTDDEAQFDAAEAALERKPSPPRRRLCRSCSDRCTSRKPCPPLPAGPARHREP